jgi:hypothetical protein
MRHKLLHTPKATSLPRKSVASAKQRLPRQGPETTQLRAAHGPMPKRGSTFILKLVPIPTNRHYLFDWSRWDGSLWDTRALPIYHNSKFLFHFRRTERLLREAKIRAVKCTRAVDDDFWCQYYGNVHRANQTLLDLNLYFCEIHAIEFLLRTSPIRGRIRETLQVLEMSIYEVSYQLQYLYALQRLIVHRTHNPLYLEDGAHRMQHRNSRELDRVNQRQEEKEKRMQHKALYGKDWQMRSVYRWSSKGDMRHRVKYTDFANGFCNTYPPRWTIIPLLAMVALHTYRSRLVLTKLDHLLGTRRTRILRRRRSTLERLRRIMTVLSWEIADLFDELAARRYYRLHHFPNSALPGEIEVGKRILMALERKRGTTRISMGSSSSMKAMKSPLVSNTRQPYEGLNTTPLRPDKNVLKTHTDTRQATPTNMNYPGLPLRDAQMRPNNHGLFRWSQWNGDDWTLDYIKPYTSHISVAAAASAKKNYITVQERLYNNSCQSLDAYLMAHYKSQYNANQLTIKLVRHVVNSSIIYFLLRTSPPKIRDHVSSQFTATGSLNFALMVDVDDLHFLRTALGACVPENPLFFKSLAMRYITGLERNKLKTKRQLMKKNHRTNSKIKTDFQGLPRAYIPEKDHIQALAKTMRDAAQIDSIFWHLQHPFSIAEPFKGIMTLVQTRFLRTYVLLRLLRRFITETTSDDMSRQIYQITDRIIDCKQQIEQLTFDLTAIRYYRAHHFPASVSEEELALGRSLREYFEPTIGGYSVRRIIGRLIQTTTERSPLVRGRSGGEGPGNQGETDQSRKTQRGSMRKGKEGTGVERHKKDQGGEVRNLSMGKVIRRINVERDKKDPGGRVQKVSMGTVIRRINMERDKGKRNTGEMKQAPVRRMVSKPHPFAWSPLVSSAIPPSAAS